MNTNTVERTMSENILSKVPAVTLGFWIIKIIATTLGETGGDLVTMSWGWGYLAGTALFLSLLVALIYLQIKSKKFHPALYWATIIASTTAGTTLADFADRSLGIGYTGGSLLLLSLLGITLWLWHRTCGTISVASVNKPKVEIFYWTAITFSQTLGTALGDWMADTNNLGYLHASFIFVVGLLFVTLLYYRSKVSKTLLFWGAFILTRPLGATLGDFIDKPISHGGLNMSRSVASLVLFAAVALLIYVLPQKAGESH